MRQFKDTNFIDAYCAYVNENGFLPPQFAEWSALSIVAGALERRVWLPWTDTYSFYPNIYVLLVGMPGDGKSQAINEAVGFLREVNRRTQQLHILPTQMTEAKFIELMGHGRSFIDRSSGRDLMVFQNAGFFAASEASSSLKNVFGDFIAVLTDLYDCPPIWERSTKKDGKTTTLKNVCMNLLAGSTFDYLGKLVNDENIMGGFASRLIYVVSMNKQVYAQKFASRDSSLNEGERATYREALVQDLSSIAKMTGPMKGDAEFAAAWEAWYPVYEKKRRALDSEKAQALMARANTNIIKTAMLFSAAESDAGILTLKHWQRAHDLVMAIQSETPSVFRKAKANSSNQMLPNNRVNAVIDAVFRNPGITFNALVAKMSSRFSSTQQARDMVQALINDGTLEGNGGGGPIRIIGNPDDHL